jgi:two-component system, chemotaxis family, protein-glutamate methylesterase/glutaminase
VNVSSPIKTASPETRPIRVMIVDDALVARGFVKRWVDAEPDLELVGSLRDGREAIERLEQIDPDVVVLDVEMPDIDGITALPLLLQKKPDLAVIMASTLTRRNAEISMKALSLGALDCVPKPEASGRSASQAFRDELIHKIRHLGRRRFKRIPVRAPIHAPARPLPRVEPAPSLAPAAVTPIARPQHPHHPHHPPVIRALPRISPKVLLIGASTGGPQALTEVVSRLDRLADRVPILITQHMPPTFTTILAEHLARVSTRMVREAMDGEPIMPGRMYLAPGGIHMRVKKRDAAVVIALDDSAPVHFCKPAVDPLFMSAAEVWGSGALGVILTGMGSDGTDGAAQIVAAGGAILAQDEETSVVWGMPGSAADAGLCSAILPLKDIAPKIIKIFSGERQ